MSLNIPRHIAIIMDGNGRWAQMQGLKRVKGHEAGAKVVRKVTRFCAD
ncbi:MAG: undecaprenyl diphosphate synthase family protein, partial [Thiovulaceae bacterium]|nr:undecaprenyl diphosphate synthase family protein [Sulfurimonadaceae bacterium]